MNIGTFIGLALLCAVLTVTLRQVKPEYGVVMSIVCGVALLMYIILSAMPVVDQVKSVLGKVNGLSQYNTLLFKCLGICFIVGLAADFCRDSGESALANKVELAGKLVLIAMAMPVILNVVEMIAVLMRK